MHGTHGLQFFGARGLQARAPLGLLPLGTALLAARLRGPVCAVAARSTVVATGTFVTVTTLVAATFAIVAITTLVPTTLVTVTLLIAAAVPVVTIATLV
ncbi:hypothetical protein, partial [Gulosibacter faecalis]